MEPTTCLACCGGHLCWVLSTKQPNNSVIWLLHNGASVCPCDSSAPCSDSTPHPTPEQKSCQSGHSGAFRALRLCRPSRLPHPFTGPTLRRTVASLATTTTQQRLETGSSFPVVSRLFKGLRTEGCQERPALTQCGSSEEGRRNIRETPMCCRTFRRGLMKAQGGRGIFMAPGREKIFHRVLGGRGMQRPVQQSRTSVDELKLPGIVRQLGDHMNGDNLSYQCQVGGLGGFTGGIVGLLLGCCLYKI